MRLAHATALALLAWTQVGWGSFLSVARRAGLGRSTDGREAASVAVDAPHPLAGPGGALPRVSVVVAAHAEEEVIAATVAALRAQTWPRERLEILVVCDGSPDATADRAREAGADVVLEPARGGKHHAQAAGVAVATGELLAFADANTIWAPDALAELLAPFADPDVGYACGRVSFLAADGTTNQEGAYWRYEMALRRRESDWHAVTAGNGAIYALRAALWPRLRTDVGHDLNLPHQTVRAGLLAVDRPTARASEPMVPTVGGEARRKRRMMNQAWRVVLTGGPTGGLAGSILDPRGLPPRYLAAIVSHRWLRYASPFLHLAALASGALLLVRRRGTVAERAAAAGHLALPVIAALPASVVGGSRPVLLVRYYVATTTTIATGLADRLRSGTPTGWDRAEGTR